MDGRVGKSALIRGGCPYLNRGDVRRPLVSLDARDLPLKRAYRVDRRSGAARFVTRPPRPPELLSVN